MHYAMPAGGGFDEATTLLCIAGQPGSGRFFLPLLSPLAVERSVYAPDLPGCAESDGPPKAAGPNEQAQGLLDFVDSMRIRRIDVLAHGQGVAVTLAMCQLRPELVDRLVLSPSTEEIRELARRQTRPVRLTELCASGTQQIATASAADLAAEIKEGLSGP